MERIEPHTERITQSTEMIAQRREFSLPGGDTITVVKGAQGFIVTSRTGSRGTVPNFNDLPKELQDHIATSFDTRH